MGTAALDSLLPEMMKVWGLDFGMNIRDEWRREESCEPITMSPQEPDVV